jgi:hypothetical protein
MVMTMDILVVDAYSGMEVCTPIFLGEASKKCGLQIIFEKNSKLNWTHPFTKLNTNKSCCGKIFGSLGMCMSLRNLSIFIQLRSISKSSFSKINTKSDITPPNNVDMDTFEVLLV